jgi:hypothetical protein
MFQALFSMDHADCGKRYLCELAATPYDYLSKEERAALEIFQVERHSDLKDKQDFKNFSRKKDRQVFQIERICLYSR